MTQSVPDSRRRSVHLGDILEVVADAVPDRRAVVTEHRSVTYAEYDERTTRLANHLVSEGVRPGEHVAIHAMNCIEWAECFIGVMKARAVPINVNYRYLHDELVHVYASSKVTMVILAPEYAEVVERVRQDVPTVTRTLSFGEEYESALARASAERLVTDRTGDDHYVLFTGGTTGLPKGVVWRQEDIIIAALNAIRLGAPIESVEQLGSETAANENPVVMCTAGPLMHGGSQWILGNSVVGGATFVLYTRHHFEPEAFLDLVATSGANSLVTLGDAMARPVAEALAREPDRWDMSSVFVVSNGAAPLSPAVREQIRTVLPGVMINDSYGASESGTTGTRLDDGTERAAPVFNVGPETTVLDVALQQCPVGEVGLLARSGRIPLGYLDDAVKTAATFKVIDGVRWVLPGDQARIEQDGSITVLGRGSQVINTGGEKVHPEEVEAVLLAHPAVFDAAVVGAPHPRWGEAVTALVSLREGAEDTEAEEVRAHCRERIADYKVPKEVIVVSEVPRTPVRKVDYRRAREVAQERVSR